MKQKYFSIILLSYVLNLPFTGITAQAFVLNGSASSAGGDCYQITPDAGGQAGSLFSQNAIDLTQPFSIDATMFFGCKDGNGADGIVFILATTNTALGVGGGGLGYQGITPSFAVEYDDYFNGNFGDPTSDHVGVLSMGSVDHTSPQSLVPPVDLTNIEDCMDHCFLATWDPVTQTLTSTLDDNTITYTGDIVANFFSGNPMVFYGFSSGTGSLSNIHRICFGPPELEAMPDVSVCENESIELQADPNGIFWRWAPNPTLSETDISNPIATPTSPTTTYTVIIEYSCGYLGYDTVVVTLVPEPVADATNNGPVCEGESLSLDATGGTSYEWSGPMGYTSFIQDPTINNIMAGNAGIYTVTVTDAAGCTATATTLVEVDTGPDIDIDPPPDPLCDNLDPIQFTASPSGGIWDGEITPGGLFDPEYAEEGIHVITYTVSNALGCSTTEEINVEVLAAPDVVIDPPGALCVNGGPIQLTGSPAGGIWEGEISISGLFDPADAGVGTHLITYTAEDGNGCSNSEQISIEVVTEQEADITTPGPFCGTDTITLMAIPPGGIWGGAANPNGQIFPFDLTPGFHLVTYQLNGINQCYYTEIIIEVHYSTTVSCPTVPPSCFNSSPFILTATPPGGIWSGAADSSGVVDPASLAPGLHMAVYTDEGNACGGNSCWSYVEIVDAPAISNVSVNCDSLSAFYTVSFSILGGDTSSYIVTGSSNGTIIPGLPFRFVSNPIPSGTAYHFEIDDIHHCFPDTVTGTNLCNCSTDAGNMDLNLITGCEDGVIQVIPPVGVTLDPDDSLVYVLHLGFPDSILLISDSLLFHLIPPLLPGVTYFVSSVAGNAAGGMGVDLTDPCLSVSFGTPIMWTVLPTGIIEGTTSICQGDSATLSFSLSGAGPYDVTYSDGSNTFFLNDISTGHTIKVSPSVSTIYTLVDVTDTTQPLCLGSPGTSHTVEVFQNYYTSLTTQVCFGDSVFVGGAFQGSGGVYVDSLQTIHGCDSILSTTLTVIALDTLYIDETSCDTMLAGVFTEVYTGLDGCDSTTITTVTWVLADTTLLQSNTCDKQSAGVFTDIYTGQTGCDSVVIETITFIPSDTTLLTGETCDAAAAGTFTQMLTNAGGCDSLVIETIQLLPSDTTSISGETCNPSEAGTFMQVLTNAGGCDSLVIESITLLPSDTSIEFHITCLPQDTGTFIHVYTNVFGCDSMVFSLTNLAPEDSCVTLRKDVFIPNVFSPNGDGINDLFLVFSKQDVVAKLPYVRIFDRWGGLVFERFNIQPNTLEQGWDGTERGEPLGPGVYVYVVNIEYADGVEETRSGSITLIR